MTSGQRPAEQAGPFVGMRVCSDRYQQVLRAVRQLHVDLGQVLRVVRLGRARLSSHADRADGGEPDCG